MEIDLTKGADYLSSRWEGLPEEEVVSDIGRLYKNKQLTSIFRTQTDRNGKKVDVRKSGADVLLNDICPSLSPTVRAVICKELVKLTPMPGIKLNSSLAGQSYTPWQKFMMWAPAAEVGTVLRGFQSHTANYPQGRFGLTAAMILAHRGENVVSKVESFLQLRLTGEDRGGRNFLDHYITSSDISLGRVKQQIREESVTSHQWDRVLVSACKNASVDVKKLAQISSVEAPISENVPAALKEAIRPEIVASIVDSDPESAHELIFNLYRRGLIAESSLLKNEPSVVESVVNGLHAHAIKSRDISVLSRLYASSSGLYMPNISRSDQAQWLIPRGENAKSLVMDAVSVGVSEHYIASKKLLELDGVPTEGDLSRALGPKSIQQKLLTVISRNPSSKKLLTSEKNGGVFYHEFCDGPLNSTEHYLVEQLVELRDYVSTMYTAERYNAHKASVAMLAAPLVELGCPIEDMSYSRDYLIDNSSGRQLTGFERKVITREVNFGLLANEYHSRNRSFQMSGFSYAKMYANLGPDDRNQIASSEVISSVSVKSMVDRGRKNYESSIRNGAFTVAGVGVLEVGLAVMMGTPPGAVAVGAFTKSAVESLVKRDTGALDVIHALKDDYSGTKMHRVVEAIRGHSEKAVVNIQHKLEALKLKTVEQIIKDMNQVDQIKIEVPERKSGIKVAGLASKGREFLSP